VNSVRLTLTDLAVAGVNEPTGKPDETDHQCERRGDGADDDEQCSTTVARHRGMCHAVIVSRPRAAAWPIAIAEEDRHPVAVPALPGTKSALHDAPANTLANPGNRAFVAETGPQHSDGVARASG